MSYRTLKQATCSLFGLFASFAGTAWAVTPSMLNMPRGVTEIDAASLSRPLGEASEIDLLLIGTGRDPWRLPDGLQELLHGAGIRFDLMPTAAAASTYNVLLDEGRRVAAVLIATD